MRLFDMTSLYWINNVVLVEVARARNFDRNRRYFIVDIEDKDIKHSGAEPTFNTKLWILYFCTNVPFLHSNDIQLYF